MEKEIKKASLEAFPVVMNVTGSDCNKRNREEYENGIRKGIEIANSYSLTQNEELKDFDVWKTWRNK